MNQVLLRNFVNLFFNALYLLIFVRVVMSWIPNLQSGKFAEFVLEITDPVLKPIQKIIPNLGGIDISPIVAFFLLQLLQGFVNSYL
ncbi:YggT family protein [bacterium (Candidatus Howlettbacteria) CG_4_10_14_0_8_um_filter_40_9]|nr:MAG: YggT family protein [bacterium (Candidatus Howlettbacteria) CG_4_10_14_0_8_um_filter_40_9]